MNKKGFTLVEIAAAIFICSLLALLAANMLIYTIRNFNRITAQAEVKDEAWIALDFIANQVKLANGYRISYRSGNTLRQLDLFISLTEGAAEHNYLIRYDSGSRRLDFGGVSIPGSSGVNELASNITDVSIVIDNEKELMYITVSAENSGESASFSTCVSLRYKELR